MNIKRGFEFYMEKYIGIIVAELQELMAIKDLMDDVDEVSLYDLKIFKGIINNKDYLLVRCGIGKVNSARTTQILTDNFDLEYVINLGSAGSLSDKLNIGDIVIGEKLVQHDFDVTAFGREKGYIPDTGKFFESDANLLNKCQNINIPNIRIHIATIASGDIFCTDISMKEKIHHKFNAIAQVCHLNCVPFIVIRSISDTPNGNNQVDFNEYLKTASKNCAEFIKQFCLF